MAGQRHILISLTIVMLVLIAVAMSPRDGFCALTGEAELGYIQREVSNNTRHDSDQIFTQRYSVLYGTGGKLVNGRLGNYNLSIGYEWLAMDYGSKRSGTPTENSAANNGHFLYSGELLLDPKEVPFRLKIYSQDLDRSTFAVDTTSGLMNVNPGGVIASSSQNSTVIPASRLVEIPLHAVAGVERNSSNTLGATLVMGVKNGMTNGYNEFLRHLPMLMLDFRDETRKSNSSTYPVDSHLTRLAFVSLNKKDNWFHYRYVTYNDNLDRTNNYNETQFQLGTVDHMLQRRWIDFTNWVRVSVDGQLTKRDNAKTDDNFEEFNLNFFATARRQYWEMRAFNTFTRLNEVNRDKITYTTSLPLYLSGTLSPATTWNVYTKYNDNHTVKGEYIRTASSSYNIDAFRTSSFTLSQGLSLEHVATSGEYNTLVASGRLATSSTQHYSRNSALSAAYVITNFRYNNDTNPTNYLEQKLSGSANYNLTNQLRLAAAQSLRHTIGKSKSMDSEMAGGVINTAAFTQAEGNSASADSYIQSITEISAVWTPRPRFNLGLYLSEDISGPTNYAKDTKTGVKGTIGYASKDVRYFGDIACGVSSIANEGTQSTISSTHSVSYIFSRSLDARAGFSFYSERSSTRRYSLFNVDQALNYSFYTANGIVRKLFEINQSFASIDGVLNNSVDNGSYMSATRRTNTLLIGAKYYPMRVMMIAGGARYSFVSSGEDAVLNFYGSLSLNFKLLDATIEYTYGKTKADSGTEKRLTANMRKRF